MMRFSRKVEYALIALVYMSQKTNGDLTTARELSERYDISLELIGKLLQSLSKAKIIISTQGVKGGYALQQTPEKVNINDVIQAVDGPIHMTRCLKKSKNEKCEREEFCNIKHKMGDIQKHIIEFLGGISLKEFASRVPAA
ncbi:Rrf2 family transcriptional regulator [candidate division KSB1 bacterium]|nr:Rrf2 family transcriptional regulator [candidate division KSB1 bacterium]